MTTQKPIKIYENKNARVASLHNRRDVNGIISRFWGSANA